MYRELPLPPGVSHLTCAWVFDGAEGRVLPDACVNVVLTGDELGVAGPATTAVEVAPTPDPPVCGVRFRVGAAALGLPVDDLRDLSVSLEEVWGAAGRRLSRRAADAATPEEALTVIVRGLAEPRSALDPAARATTTPGC